MKESWFPRYCEHEHTLTYYSKTSHKINALTLDVYITRASRSIDTHLCMRLCCYILLFVYCNKSTHFSPWEFNQFYNILEPSSHGMYHKTDFNFSVVMISISCFIEILGFEITIFRPHSHDFIFFEMNELFVFCIRVFVYEISAKIKSMMKISHTW